MNTVRTLYLNTWAHNIFVHLSYLYKFQKIILLLAAGQRIVIDNAINNDFTINNYKCKRSLNAPSRHTFLDWHIRTRYFLVNQLSLFI